MAKTIFSLFSVLKVKTILIENSQLEDNIPKSFGLTILNILQLLSQPEELYVKEKKKKRFLGFGRMGRIFYDPTQSYNFYNPCAILNILVR